MKLAGHMREQPIFAALTAVPEIHDLPELAAPTSLDVLLAKLGDTTGRHANYDTLLPELPQGEFS